MLSFFRRIVNSKVGVIVTFVVLGVIALAFAAGDVTGTRTSGMGGLTGNNVAKVGKGAVSVADLRSAAENEVQGIRQQQPTFDMAQFVAGGGLDATLERSITGVALDEFGRAQGMVVSKRAVDGQIASIPGLQGPNGKFDPSLYQRILAERKLTDATIRRDIARDMIAQQLTLPTVGASQMPQQLALPYASLLLEKRAGQIGIIPIQAVANTAAPSDADIATYYQRNIARYTVPQRRVVRYALVTPDAVKAGVTPTDAEIAQAYQADRAKYAASEKRTITQVIVGTQAGAGAIAAKVKGGASLADAARAAGLEASTQAGVTKTAYAGIVSPTVADAVFAAAKGGVVGPVKGVLGYVVARVDGVEQVPGRSLDQVRGEIADTLAKAKQAQALTDLRDKIDDAVSKNATFDEVVADHKLQAVTTPPLLASGADPENAAAKPDPALAPLLAAAFQAEEGDAPELVTTGTDGGFAIAALGRIVPAAPEPLAKIRSAVARDLMIDRARQAARKVAADVVAKVNKGAPLAQALGQTGLKLPASQPIAASRAQIAANPRGAQPPLVLMFSMAQGTAKMIEAPNNSGWLIVKLDRIDAGNATGNANVINATRADLGRSIGREYAEQFARAVRAQVGVKTDAKAVAKVRAELTGQGGSNN